MTLSDFLNGRNEQPYSFTAVNPNDFIADERNRNNRQFTSQQQ